MEKNNYKLQDLTVKSKDVMVRTLCNLSFSFSLNFDLPNDSRIIFRFRGGRNNKNDWYYLQTNDQNKKGYVTLKVLKTQAKLVPMLITGKDLLIKYLICEKNGVEKNRKFQFNVYNSLSQSLVEKEKKIDILVQFPDQKPIPLEDGPSFNVKHSNFDHITLICPSLVGINEEFEILIRIEDKYKNLVEDFSNKIRIFELKENTERSYINDVDLEKKNNGILRIEGLQFTQPGVRFIEAFYNNLYFRSNPIVCQNNPIKRRLYWGFIHGHTIKSDGIRELDDYFNNLLNAGLDFGNSTEHDHLWETSKEDFEEIKKVVKNYHNEGKFISFFGYEWGHWYSYSGFGDICIYYFDDSLPIFSSDLQKFNSTKKLIKNLSRFKENVLMIGHHTALRPGYRNWDYFDNSLEKLVEIYSAWGNQEYSYAQGNPLPPRYKFFGYGDFARVRGAIIERKESFVSSALRRGFKLGFTAGGDDHIGIYPSGSIDPDNGIYPPGIMAIWAEDLTKEALWESLHKRKCYGTTGPRVIIEFYLDQYFMGDILKINENPSYVHSRTIKMVLISPINIEKIELIRNNEVILRKEINSNQCEEVHIDSEPFESINLDHSTRNEKFVFYYLRTFLANDNMAWSTPIWIINE